MRSAANKGRTAEIQRSSLLDYVLTQVSSREDEEDDEDEESTSFVEQMRPGVPKAAVNLPEGRLLQARNELTRLDLLKADGSLTKGASIMRKLGFADAKAVGAAVLGMQLGVSRDVLLTISLLAEQTNLFIPLKLPHDVSLPAMAVGAV